MYKVKKGDSGHGGGCMQTSSQALVDASQAHRLPIIYRNSFWVLDGLARSDVLFYYIDGLRLKSNLISRDPSDLQFAGRVLSSSDTSPYRPTAPLPALILLAVVSKDGSGRAFSYHEGIVIFNHQSNELFETYSLTVTSKETGLHAIAANSIHILASYR
jgi:hypothetical protein